jgi:hypothetical protein
MTTGLYYDHASVYGREAKVGAGLEYLIFDMRLEEEEYEDVDEIEAIKKRQREGLDKETTQNEETTQTRERDQNSKQRKPS